MNYALSSTSPRVPPGGSSWRPALALVAVRKKADETVLAFPLGRGIIFYAGPVEALQPRPLDGAMGGVVGFRAQ